MRLGHAARLALALMVGCARFGYDPLQVGIDADAASYDAGDPSDGARQGSMDGSADAASSGTGACEFTITMNTYLGSPRFHGWLSLQNAGRTTWATPTISFDLPSSAHVCNDADALPGAGWALQSSGGHCTYTKTSPSLSIASGATLDFEYSSNDSATPAGAAATNVGVSGCR